ncbi:MAG TPA: DapH/DapD/GlmU-related protein [Patescibacteria group bacterium]
MLKDRMGNSLTAHEATKKGLNRIFNIWLDLWLWKLRLIDCVPIHFVRRWAFRISGVKIGKDTIIHQGARFFYPAGVEIGEDTIIGDHAFLDGRAKLTIGSHVDVASSVHFYCSEHDINAQDFGAIEEPVTIGDYCFIGPRAIILPGVTIGKGAVVAAGAVVTKNVGDFEVVGGVPAKVIGERMNKNPQYRLGRARLFQ